MGLEGRRILVTSGPTRAPLDAVRFISNKSSGRLGSLIAEDAVQRGATVTYVYGRPSAVPAARGGTRDQLRLVPIETVDDLVRVFRRELPEGRYDAVIHAMAVLDFQPVEASAEKTSSEVKEWTIRLVPTPKAITLVKDLSPRSLLVGFKLEVARNREELAAIAHATLVKYRCDLVIANDQREIEAGRHTGYFVMPDGRISHVAIGKETIAATLVEFLEERLGANRP